MGILASDSEPNTKQINEGSEKILEEEIKTSQRLVCQPEICNSH